MSGNMADHNLTANVKKFAEDAIPLDVYNYRKIGTKTVRLSESTRYGAIYALVVVPIFKRKDAIELLGELS